MDFNIFGQISKIVGRQITNISKKVTRAVKVAAKPFVYLNTYVRAQVKSMTRRPSSKADYVRFGDVYLSKRFLGLSVIVIVLVVTTFSTVVYPWLEGRLWTPTILLNSEKMAGYTGPAHIRNDMGVVIYSGDVAAGKLTGSATQYDTEGNLVYTGEFLNAAYNGYGSLIPAVCCATRGTSRRTSITARADFTTRRGLSSTRAPLSRACAAAGAWSTARTPIPSSTMETLPTTCGRAAAWSMRLTASRSATGGPGGRRLRGGGQLL